MRMTNFAQAIAKALGLSDALRELLYITAPMHDVGKIGIADSVLLKPGKLTPDEFEIMKTHTDIGMTILEGKDELIVAARDIAGSHHERWDGAGYPRGLKGEAIPLLARICAVADVFDALTSTRPYKKAWPVDEAVAWVTAESGKHFDPAIVTAFNVAMPDILRIRELYRDDIIDPKQVLTLPAIRQRETVWIPWEDDLRIGIDTIDAHHRYLFDLINDLYEVVVRKRGAREVARLIKALDAYAKIHFRAEEQMMDHYGYQGTHRQLQQHHAFEEKISEFYEELHANPFVTQFDVLIYMREWLIHHIRVEDIQLIELIKK
jgi:hemerythrin-like metal-binding protein